MRSFTRPSTAFEGTWRQPSRNSARARLGKISLALGRTARAGNSASCSEANTATGPPKPLSSSSVAVRPEVPEGGPELPDGGAEGGVLGLREQRHCRAPETLLGGTEAVEERRGADLDDHPQKGACGYACGGDERRPRDALWGQAHGPDCYGRPVREPHERRTLQAEAVEDVLHPEGVAVPLRRGPLLRAPARLADDVWRVEAVALGQRQKPLKAGGIQGVGSRQEDDGRGVLGSYRQDVGVAEACADCQALVAWAQPGQRLVVERSDLGLALWRFVDGF